MFFNCFISIHLTLADIYREKHEKVEWGELQGNWDGVGGQRTYGSDTSPSLPRHKGRL